MTETENQVNINGIENDNSNSNPEELLDNAITSIKNNSNLESQEEKQATDIVEFETKKETLRLPEKKEKFVETDNPEVQQRINELYKKTKISEEQNSLLKDELMRMTEGFETREMQLQNQLRELQNRYIEDDRNKTLTDLRNQYTEAVSELNLEEAQKINEKILDFKYEAKYNDFFNKIQQQQQVSKPVKQEFYNNPNDAVEANKLVFEKNENNEFVRPWLQENHPEFNNVVDMMAAISNKYIRKNERPSISVVMQEIDKMMGVGQNKGNSNTTLKHAPVLSSNATLNAGSEQTIKLSDLEKSFAHKMGVSEKDYARMRKISNSGPISIDKF